MKKKKPIKTPALFPNSKKEMLKIIQDPEKMNRVFEMISASSNLIDKTKTLKAISLLDWESRCLDILPENLENKENFIESFKQFLQNYGEINGTTNE